MYTDNDQLRVIVEHEKPDVEAELYRTEFRRDYARLIHSPSFRRLQGKTQLFPWFESDIFRNRLIHSLEVAQIAKSIAIRINNVFQSKDPENFIDTDLVEFAALAHDLGHPPFGHIGEAALDECMIKSGGFEGNAQTLRLLTKQEKKLFGDRKDYWITKDGDDRRVGLNLTYRSLASILKYDRPIPLTKKDRKKYSKNNGEKEIKPVKGYYLEEQEIVDKIKAHIQGGSTPHQKFKTIECKIMDIADDIAYSTYDLEDGLKAGFYNPLDIVFAKKEVLRKIAKKLSEKIGTEFTVRDVQGVLVRIFKDVFPDVEIEGFDLTSKNIKSFLIMNFSHTYKTAKELSNSGFHRTKLTSEMVGRFIQGVNYKLDKKSPAFSSVFLSDDTLIQVETLKLYNYYSQILSPKLKIIECRGNEIVKHIFKTLTGKGGKLLLPEDYQELLANSPKSCRDRIICDYISGMTDNFCLEFYGRLTSEKPETIFKPSS